MAKIDKTIVTSKDVAKLAGVSQSTVSRVFIPGSSVSFKAQQKVIEAAKALNYRPNAFARSLNSNQSNLIGLVFPDTDYPIHMKTLQLISSHLQARGFSTVLMPWHFNEQNQHELPNIFQYKVDGVIVASATLNRSLYEECQALGIPIVQYARVIPEINHSYVISDMYSAGKKAAELLFNQGLEEAVYVSGSIPTFTDALRFSGFSEMFHKLAGKTVEKFVTDYNYDLAVGAIKGYFESHKKSDVGFFCATDNLAFAVMDVAKYHFGLSIPNDIQVIGFDDVPQAKWLSYELTTFKQDFERLASEAVNILVEKIENNDSAIIKLLIPCELIQRESTK